MLLVMFGDLGRVMATNTPAWRVRGKHSAQSVPLISQDSSARVQSENVMGIRDLSIGSLGRVESNMSSARGSVDAGLPHTTAQHGQDHVLPDKFIIRSCNISAWRPHAEELLSWDANVVLMQESRLTGVAQQQATQQARAAGRHLVHGEPVPQQNSRQDGQAKRRQVKHTIWNGRQGGVSIMSLLLTQTHLVHDTLYDSDRNLWERQRFAVARVPLAKNKSILVASFYGMAGGGDARRDDQNFECNERMLQQVFECAARFGDVPFIVGMDANIQVCNSPAILAALATTRWHDVGAIFADSGGMAPTYSQDPDWDRHSVTKGATRIDYMLVNSAALTALRGFRIIRDAGLPGHLVLEAEFNFQAFREEGYMLRKPAPYPLQQMPQYDEATVEEVAARTWQPYEAAFCDALHAGQSDLAWNLLNRGLESFLDDVAGDLPRTWSTGRGKSPVFDRFAPKAPHEAPRGELSLCTLDSFKSCCSNAAVTWHNAGGMSDGMRKVDPLRILISGSG